MKQVLQIIKNDFRSFIKYNILQTIIILSVLFAGTMVFLPSVNPLILVFITVFIIPVILLSVSIFIEKQENTLFPLSISECSSLQIIVSKVISALLLLLIPFVLEILIMYFVLHMSFNFFLFLLIYMLSAVIHAAIGITLAIMSRSSSIMSFAYIGYIVIFSVMPIFYIQGLIPTVFEYVLVVSPAYLSGILFQQVIFGYTFSPDWLIITAVLLQLVYIGVMTFFVIIPYFKSYLFTHLENREVE